MQRRRMVAILAIPLILVAALAGEEGAEVRTLELPISWDVGTKVDLTLEAGTKHFDGATLLREGMSTSRITLEVVGATEEEYRFRWTIHETVLPEALRENALVASAVGVLKGVTLELLADRYGSVQSLRNADELRPRFAPLIQQARAAAMAAGASPEAMKAVDPMIESLMAEGFEGNLLKHPRMFTLAAGGAYTLGKEQTYEDSLPFPLSGEAIPSLGSFLLESVDDAAGTAEVVWRQRLDPEKSGAIIRGYLRELLRKAGKEADEEQLAALEALTFDIRDEARFDYDLKTGFPRTVASMRDARTGTRRRVDWLRFTVTSVHLPEPVEGDR